MVDAVELSSSAILGIDGTNELATNTTPDISTIKCKKAAGLHGSRPAQDTTPTITLFLVDVKRAYTAL